MKVSIKQEGLLKVFDIDGKTLYPSAYMSYHTEPENVERMKARGIKLFMFPVYFGDEGINMESGLRPMRDCFFTGYGQYNYAVVDELLQMIAGNGEEEVYVIPRVCLEPPKWWQERYPEEVARDYRGEPQRECFASKKWREDMTVVLQALIDHIETSCWKNNVIGYHIAAGGTEEWAYQSRYRYQYYDYSEPNLEAYRTFLQEKYSSVEALSASWKQRIGAWEEVRFPLPIERTYAKRGFVRDPEEEKPVLDYYDFHNEIVADTISYFCRQVKEYIGGTRVTGAFYGYVFSMPQNKKGLHALGKLLESPDIDFISTTNTGIAWSFSSAVASVLLSGKMWMAEGDIRTCLTMGLQEKMPYAAPDNDYYSSRVWVGPKTMELSCSSLTRAMSRILTAPCGIWWFDMFGGWFKEERMESVIGKAEELMRCQTHDYLKTEVAVILDEKGHKYSGLSEDQAARGMWELIDNLARMGTTYHTYLASDLQKKNFPADDYKLYIFVANTDPLPETVQAIEQKLKRGGKTLLWLHTSSCYNAQLCDFRLEPIYDGYAEKAEYQNHTYPEQLLPVWSFAEEEGYVLSRFADSRKPAVIWKQMAGYSSVYSLHLAPTPQLLQQIALLSGVHLYNLANDLVYAGGEYIAIRALESGYRRLNLPESGFLAENALTGEPITVNDMFIDLKMEAEETVLIHLQKQTVFDVH